MSHSITQKNINSGSITDFKAPFSADEQAPPKDPSVIYDKVGLID